jgi:hypothetical protein
MLRRQQERREVKVKHLATSYNSKSEKINDARDQVAQLHH